MKKFLLISLLATLLSGCSYILYRPDMQQGNTFDSAMLSQLRPGMSAAQVKYIMGNPVLTHTFNPQRWDYVYTYRHGTKPATEKRVALYFNNGRLVKVSEISS